MGDKQSLSPTSRQENKKQLIIKAGENAVEVLEIQPENSKKMNAKDFLNGKQIISDKVN